MREAAKGHQHALGIRGGSSKCSRDKGKLAAIPEAGAVNLQSEKEPHAVILYSHPLQLPRH